MLAPEIKHAAGLTATFMRSADNHGNKELSNAIILFGDQPSTLFMPHPDWLFQKIITMRDELFSMLGEIADKNSVSLKNPFNLTFYLTTLPINWNQIADILMSSNQAVVYVRTASGLSRSNQVSDIDIKLPLEKMRIFDAFFLNSKTSSPGGIRKLSVRETQIISFIHVQITII